MLKGGVIMDVVTPEEARIAEEAGAVAVMALERVPADIRRQGGVARMSDPQARAVRGCACLCCLSLRRGLSARHTRAPWRWVADGQGDQARSHHPRHGQGPHRALCGGADSGGLRHRLH